MLLIIPMSFAISTVENSTTTGSFIANSTVNNSIAINCRFINITANGINVTGMNATSSILDEVGAYSASRVISANIYNSTIYGGTINRTTVNASTIRNVRILNSTITNSNLNGTNVTNSIVEGLTLIKGIITNNIVTSGTAVKTYRVYVYSTTTQGLLPGQEITVMNMTGQTVAAAATNEQGFMSFSVNYTSATHAYNYTVHATGTSDNKLVNFTTLTPLNFYVTPPVGGGGGSTTEIIPEVITPEYVTEVIAPLQTFSELMALPVEVLQELTPDQVTELVDRLGMTVPELILLFTTMTPVQQVTLMEGQGGGGGGFTDTQKDAIREATCVTGDNFCPGYCTPVQDVDCAPVCGNGKAEKDENFLSCPADVPFDLNKLPDLLASSVFLKVIFFGIIATGVYLTISKPKGKKNIR
jgi:hypothetical protein